MSNLVSMQQRTEDVNTRITNIEQALANQEKIQVITTAAATVTPGVEQVFINYSGVCQITLSNPITGTPGVGSSGQDGTTLEFTDITGHAHQIMTGTNGINGSKHVATLPATVGASTRFKAFSGSYWVQVVQGVTLT